MSYFGFLAIFLGIPIAALAVVRWIDRRRGRPIPPGLRTWPPEVAIGVLVLIAVVYTTPWDNYLVATKVWWYDTELVTGIVLGYYSEYARKALLFLVVAATPLTERLDINLVSREWYRGSTRVLLGKPPPAQRAGGGCHATDYTARRSERCRCR